MPCSVTRSCSKTMTLSCGHCIAHKCLREWLRTAPCVPLVPSAVSEIFHTEQPVLIGFSIHACLPHVGVPTWHLVVCVACGAWSTSAARNLSRPCTGQPTKVARDALTRLEKGLPPRLHVLLRVRRICCCATVENLTLFAPRGVPAPTGTPSCQREENHRHRHCHRHRHHHRRYHHYLLPFGLKLPDHNPSLLMVDITAVEKLLKTYTKIGQKVQDLWRRGLDVDDFAKELFRAVCYDEVPVLKRIARHLMSAMRSSQSWGNAKKVNDGVFKCLQSQSSAASKPS